MQTWIGRAVSQPVEISVPKDSAASMAQGGQGRLANVRDSKVDTAPHRRFSRTVRTARIIAMQFLETATMVLSLSGVLGFCGCVAWLIYSAFRDGAITDVLWLWLTGEPIIRYVLTQWGSAKRPVFGILLSILLFVVGIRLGKWLHPDKPRIPRQAAIAAPPLAASGPSAPSSIWPATGDACSPSGPHPLFPIGRNR